MGEVRVFGIRHHGPGSTRSLLGALVEFEPDAVLIEAPADAEAALQFAGHEGLIPPVALLVYASEDSKQAIFYPQTVFSPEWNAARYALAKGAALRAMDLPAAIRFSAAQSEQAEEEPEERELETAANQDPFALIAEASGYPDGEAWWEHLIEERRDPTDVFLAVTELMSSLREQTGEDPDAWGAKREAHMRLAIRKAESDGFARIAVVCGAWHVPALLAKTPASADQALLKGLPKLKTSATWVPYTHERITYASGYGAGVRSPGYYQHLWETPAHNVVPSWLLKSARLLREEGYDASTASVIEAVRLSEALSAVRGRPSPGLRELSDATLTVLTHGRDEPLRTIHRRLIVGTDIGEVPPEVPTVPLQSDLEALQKRLRLKPELLERRLELDLRNETDLARSHVLHRLNLLSIPWGDLQHVGGKQGTFHEHWLLRWRPELAIQVIEASRWGGSVEAAASALALDAASRIDMLPPLTRLAHDVLLADLDGTIPAVMKRLEDAAVVATDTKALLEALPPLGRVMRYGDVRKTSVDAVGHVFSSIFVRGCVGLPPATSQLDDEAAQAMVDAIDGAQSVVSLVADAEREQMWFTALETVAGRPDVHKLVSGRVTRLLLDGDRIEAEDASNALSRSGSVGSAPADTAAWIQGFLAGSGTVLLHHDKLWTVLDEWICGLAGESFFEVLPLLRRTFSTFARPERRLLGERVSGQGAVNKIADAAINLDRAQRPLPLLRLMLGMEETA
jgi:hypothetical protein